MAITGEIMKQKNILATAVATTICCMLAGEQALAAIALDRTRVIFPGDSHSQSLTVRNENTQSPYLAQAWMEDASGKKISSPFAVLPPLQRVEPGSKSQIEIKALPEAGTLPQDRESLYYFNMREIPPRSNKPNVLQLALQTHIKFFYRPQALTKTESQMSSEHPWQEQLTLSKKGDHYQVSNPTGYFITLVNASSRSKGAMIAGFEPVMVAPKDNALLKGSAAAMGSSPVLTYIDDYGGRNELLFSCAGNQCHAVSSHR